MFIKVYHSFGSEHHLLVQGHVFENEALDFDVTNSWIYTNIKSLLNLFKIKTIAHVPLELEIFGEKTFTTSDDRGFFKFQLNPKDNIPAGWHAIKVSHAEDMEIFGEGKIFVPYRTSFSIVSDIDDTVMKSYSATIFRRLYEMVSKNPEERKIFEHTVDWYQMLARSNPPGEETNAFFYVSSSEWNLYEYLNIVFKKHQLPEGIFLLNHLKSMSSFFKTGKTGHEGKIERIHDLLQSFPEQQFVFIGDNTQKDPMIYLHMSEKHASNVRAVFIRNKSKENTKQTQVILEKIAKYNIPVLLFEHTQQAIQYSKELGLIH